MADAEITAQVLAPPDIEERFGLTGGHIFQGELVPEQAFDMRPVPGSKSYQGPIPASILCGSGAWPGGCVMGAPGHNASHEAIDAAAGGGVRVTGYRLSAISYRLLQTGCWQLASRRLTIGLIADSR